MNLNRALWEFIDMIITLFKNCILTNAYKEIIDVNHKDSAGKTPLELYLETLTSFSITVDNTYVSNEGVLLFELLDSQSHDIYEYNYMKLESNAYSRYCFIKDIKVIDEVARITYEEDIWTTYAPSMSMRKSLLSRSRNLSYKDTNNNVVSIPFYNVPMQYEGNNELLYSYLGTSTDLGRVNIVLQLQTYESASYGVTTARSVRNVVMAFQKTGSSSASMEFRLNHELETILNTLLITESSAKLSYDNNVLTPTPQYWFEISNIMLIPSSFALGYYSGKILASSNKKRFMHPLNTWTDIGGNTIKSGIVWFYELDESLFDIIGINIGAYGKMMAGISGTITNNFKNKMIGTFSNNIEVVNNGSAIKYAIYFVLDDFSFRILLNVQNQVIDITNDFIINIPVSVQTGEATQQQATARAISNLNATLGLARNVYNVAAGIGQTAIGSELYGAGVQRSQLKTRISGYNEMSTGEAGMIGGITGIVSSIGDFISINQKSFVTNKSANVTNSSAINAYYGLVIFRIDSDNDTEVNNTIAESGYVCNEIVPDIINGNTYSVLYGKKYDILQFEYVRLHGKFSQNIMSRITNILENGFKIWYDHTAIAGETY